MDINLEEMAKIWVWHGNDSRPSDTWTDYAWRLIAAAVECPANPRKHDPSRTRLLGRVDEITQVSREGFLGGIDCDS